MKSVRLMPESANVSVDTWNKWFLESIPFATRLHAVAVYRRLRKM